MHLRNVEIYCDVVAQRSFSRAAEVSDITQSAVSQAVHQLEKQLGATLLDRSVRPFELTEAGETYYQGCKEILKKIRAVEDSVQQISNRVTGRVHVAAIYSVGLLEMKSWIQTFQQEFPDVEVHLEYLHPREVCEWVLQRKVDLGLISFPNAGADFTVTPWQDQKMVMAVANHHRLATQKQVSVKELEGEKMVNFSQELKIRKSIDRWLKNAGVLCRTAHEFDNIEYIKRAVEIGSGIAILPEATIKKEVESGSLHVVHLDDADWTRPLGIIHKKGRTLTSASAKFAALLQCEKLEPVENNVLVSSISKSSDSQNSVPENSVPPNSVPIEKSSTTKEQSLKSPLKAK